MTGTYKHKDRKDGRRKRQFTVNGHKYYVYGTTEKELDEKERDKRREIADGITTNKTVTLNQYAAQYFIRKEGVIKPNTIRTERSTLKAPLAIIGSRKVCKIDRQTILSLQVELKKTLTPQGVNHRLTLLHAIFKEAVLDGILKSNPCEGVRALRVTSKPARETIHRALERPEQAAFIKAAAGSWYYEFYLTAIQTGMRPGELAALEWAAVDTKAGLIHVRSTLTRTADGKATTGTPKTRTSKRDIPLTEPIKAILKRQRMKCIDRFGAISKRVFPAYNGGLVRESVIDRDIARICKAAGIALITSHAFRDTYATRAAESGIDYNVLKELLGHESLAMTADLYAHVLKGTKRKAVEAVDFGISAAI